MSYTPAAASTAAAHINVVHTNINMSLAATSSNMANVTHMITQLQRLGASTSSDTQQLLKKYTWLLHELYKLLDDDNVCATAFCSSQHARIEQVSQEYALDEQRNTHNAVLAREMMTHLYVGTAEGEPLSPFVIDGASSPRDVVIRLAMMDTAKSECEALLFKMRERASQLTTAHAGNTQALERALMEVSVPRFHGLDGLRAYRATCMFSRTNTSFETNERDSAKRVMVSLTSPDNKAIRGGTPGAVTYQELLLPFSCVRCNHKCSTARDVYYSPPMARVGLLLPMCRQCFQASLHLCYVNEFSVCMGCTRRYEMFDGVFMRSFGGSDEQAAPVKLCTQCRAHPVFLTQLHRLHPLRNSIRFIATTAAAVVASGGGDDDVTPMSVDNNASASAAEQIVRMEEQQQQHNEEEEQREKQEAEQAAVAAAAAADHAARLETQQRQQQQQQEEEQQRAKQAAAAHEEQQRLATEASQRLEQQRVAVAQQEEAERLKRLRRAAEEQLRASMEAQRLADEECARLEEERVHAEEAARVEREHRADEEDARVAQQEHEQQQQQREHHQQQRQQQHTNGHHTTSINSAAMDVDEDSGNGTDADVVVTSTTELQLYDDMCAAIITVFRALTSAKPDVALALSTANALDSNILNSSLGYLEALLNSDTAPEQQQQQQ
jgi:hypothetical protein